MSVKPPTIYPGVDSIRQIQELMVMCSLLPANGRLADLLRRALDTPAEPIQARLSPVADLHPHAVKEWFERNWSPDQCSAMERALLEWQKSNENMGPAIVELRNAESVLGFKLVAVATS